MDKINKLTVHFGERIVGTLALYENSRAAFEYNTEWLGDGFSLNPYSLPLEKRVFISAIDPFDGLFGVFNDSLPDGWGRLLVDRFLAKNNTNPMTVSCMDRLVLIGSSGMGALSYEPDYLFDIHEPEMDLDRLATECGKLLKTDFSEELDELYLLGGSSGGARPKILTRVDGDEWIIKFPSSIDMKNIGEREYRYSLCAKECGILMEETRLFPSKICSGYFGTRRFDRVTTQIGNERRIHMVSAGGFLETTHRIPNLDYNILMKLTLQLTRDFMEVEKLFRLMCFNVFAHNRDDHAKNFSFLYDDRKRRWLLSPAYDLTYSASIGGEHATYINGNGKNPGLSDILEVAEIIGIKERKAKSIADEIYTIVFESKL